MKGLNIVLYTFTMRLWLALIWHWYAVTTKY